MSPDDTTRRRVLRTGGTVLAALAGATGTAAGAPPEPPCPGCDDGGGGGGGSLEKPTVRTRPPLLYGDPTLVGELQSTGGADEVDAWFEWGEEGDGLPYDTPIQRVDAYTWFDHTESFPDGTYEYRAVASNDAGLARGAVETFTV